MEAFNTHTAGGVSSAWPSRFTYREGAVQQNMGLAFQQKAVHNFEGGAFSTGGFFGDDEDEVGGKTKTGRSFSGHDLNDTPMEEDW